MAVSKINDSDFVHNIENFLKKEYRGVNIAVYALAVSSLAIAIHKIRPVSKFSKASNVPDHFINKHEPLKGVYVGVQHSPVRLLIDHKAPLYLPLWHSSKSPLPVKLWGINVAGGNAVTWLECVAKGQKVTLNPIARDNDALVSTVQLHLLDPKSKTAETIDIGQRLVELGFAKASVPQQINKNTIEYKIAPVLLSAETKAKSYRKGIWLDILPPVPFYVTYWRKGIQLTQDTLILLSINLFNLLKLATKNIIFGTKNLILKSFKTGIKMIKS